MTSCILSFVRVVSSVLYHNLYNALPYSGDGHSPSPGRCDPIQRDNRLAGPVHQVQQVVPIGRRPPLVNPHPIHHARQPRLLAVRVVLAVAAEHEHAAATARPATRGAEARVLVTEQVQLEVVSGLLGDVGQM